MIPFLTGQSQLGYWKLNLVIRYSTSNLNTLIRLNMLKLAVITHNQEVALPASWTRYAPDDELPPAFLDLVFIDDDLSADLKITLKKQWEAQSWCLLTQSLSQPNLETTLLTRGLASLKSQLIFDPMTGLFSRRYMESALATHWAQHQRAPQQSFALLLLDMDNLKAINTQHGHPTGDKALRALGQSIHSQLRTSDIAGRWGGDEFVFLLLNTHNEGAKLLLNRIQQTLPKTLSVSGGWWDSQNATEHYGDAIAVADQMLRANKRNP